MRVVEGWNHDFRARLSKAKGNVLGNRKGSCANLSGQSPYDRLISGLSRLMSLFLARTVVASGALESPGVTGDD